MGAPDTIFFFEKVVLYCIAFPGFPGVRNVVETMTHELYTYANSTRQRRHARCASFEK